MRKKVNKTLLIFSRTDFSTNYWITLHNIREGQLPNCFQDLLIMQKEPRNYNFLVFNGYKLGINL